MALARSLDDSMASSLFHQLKTMPSYLARLSLLPAPCQWPCTVVKQTNSKNVMYRRTVCCLNKTGHMFTVKRGYYMPFMLSAGWGQAFDAETVPILLLNHKFSLKIEF